MSSGRVIDEYDLDSLEDGILESDPNISGKYLSSKVSKTKQLNADWWWLQKTIRVQPNWGRIQQAGKEEYEILIPPARGQTGSRSRNLIRQSSPTIILDQSIREEPLEIDEVAEYLLRVEPLSITKLIVKLKQRGASPEQFEWFRSLLNRTLEKELNELDSVENFVKRAQRLEANGNIDAALDLIYDSVDEFLRNGDFKSCDALIGDLRADDWSVDVLVGFLTATLPASDKLPSRIEFFREIERVLLDRDEFEDGILTGLEGL